jgi:hypothetical protein
MYIKGAVIESIDVKFVVNRGFGVVLPEEFIDRRLLPYWEVNAWVFTDSHSGVLCVVKSTSR